jgi:hypothetical protein
MENTKLGFTINLLKPVQFVKEDLPEKPEPTEIKATAWGLRCAENPPSVSFKYMYCKHHATMKKCGFPRLNIQIITKIVRVNPGKARNAYSHVVFGYGTKSGEM